MTGQRGLHGDLRGLQIADFADHHDVGILAQECPHGAREGEADLPLHLHLVDAGDLIFDGVLDREDLAVRRVERAERGVERGRLAAAGRARRKQDAVGLLQQGEDMRQRDVVEAQRREVHRQRPAIEDAQHRAFAVNRRHQRDAEVDVLAAHRQADAPVLGDAAFGDVQPGHDLDARENGRRQGARRRFDLVKHAVDAVAHAKIALAGLDMDVGGARLDRAADEMIHQPDDRGIAGTVADAVGIFGGCLRDVARGLRRYLMQARLAGAVQSFEGGFEIGRQRHAANDGPSRGEAGRFGGVVVERIDHRDRQSVRAVAERQDLVLAQELPAEVIGKHGFARIVGGRGHGEVHQRREPLGDVVFGGKPQPREDDFEPFAAFVREPQGALRTGGRELGVFDQPVEERAAHQAGTLRDGRDGRDLPRIGHLFAP